MWAPATVYQTTLQSHSVDTSARSEPRRVCGEPIMLGDACLARRWHVGYAHIKCGWFVPADLNWEE